MFCSLSNSRTKIGNENQQQYNAKSSLYQLAEQEDLLDFELGSRKTQLSCSRIDKIEKWTDSRQSIIFRLEGQKDITNKKIKRSKKHQIQSQILPKVRNVLKQYNDSQNRLFNEPIKLKKPSTPSINNTVQLKTNRLTALRQRRFSRTPNIQLSNEYQQPTKLNLKQQNLGWMISCKPLKKQVSLSKSILPKRNAQSKKQNINSQILLKQIKKLKNEWVQCQKSKIKPKHKIHLLSYI